MSQRDIVITHTELLMSHLIDSPYHVSVMPFKITVCHRHMCHQHHRHPGSIHHLHPVLQSTEKYTPAFLFWSLLIHQRITLVEYMRHSHHIPLQHTIGILYTYDMPVQIDRPVFPLQLSHYPYSCHQPQFASKLQHRLAVMVASCHHNSHIRTCLMHLQQSLVIHFLHRSRRVGTVVDITAYNKGIRFFLLHYIPELRQESGMFSRPVMLI